jgi:hypothetical protein
VCKKLAAAQLASVRHVLSDSVDPHCSAGVQNYFLDLALDFEVRKELECHRIMVGRRSTSRIPELGLLEKHECAVTCEDNSVRKFVILF